MLMMTITKMTTTKIMPSIASLFHSPQRLFQLQIRFSAKTQVLSIRVPWFRAGYGKLQVIVPWLDWSNLITGQFVTLGWILSVGRRHVITIVSPGYVTERERHFFGSTKACLVDRLSYRNSLPLKWLQVYSLRRLFIDQRGFQPAVLWYIMAPNLSDR